MVERKPLGATSRRPWRCQPDGAFRKAAPIDRKCELTMTIALRESLRTELRMLNDALKPARRRRLSATQKVALQVALAGRLQLYPRGYAASKTGPFHSRRAILGLVRAGLMNLSATARYAAVTKRA